MTKTVLLAALLAAVGVARPARGQTPIDRRVPVSSAGQVSIHNTAGSVEVIGWDRDEIQISGTLGHGTERLDVTTRGDATEIRVIIPRRANNVQGSDLTVRLPARGRVSVETVSADIELRGVAAAVELTTVSGDVTASGTTAGVSARTVSGDMILRGAGGNIDLSTVSGDATITGRRFRALRYESVSGDLTFAGTLDPNGASTITTHSGDVVISIPSESDLAVDFSSFSGDLTNAFGPTAERTSRYGPGSSLRFMLGTGSAGLRINTFSGDVQLQRQ